jgi:hypothetical protein
LDQATVYVNNGPYALVSDCWRDPGFNRALDAGSVTLSGVGKMESHHWIGLVVIAVVFYLIGAKYPVYAARLGF